MDSIESIGIVVYGEKGEQLVRALAANTSRIVYITGPDQGLTRALTEETFVARVDDIVAMHQILRGSSAAIWLTGTQAETRYQARELQKSLQGQKADPENREIIVINEPDFDGSSFEGLVTDATSIQKLGIRCVALRRHPSIGLLIGGLDAPAIEQVMPLITSIETA